MKYIKSIVILAVIFISTTAFVNYNPSPEPAHNHDLKWHTSFDEASALSRKEGKPIFAFFTGSDWCGWCTRLKANVFSKDDFKKWANESVILLELDFPRRTQLPPKVMQQNRELAQLFKVKGYPTVWIFNAVKDPKTNQMSINALGSLGYPRAEAGKESVKFVADANAILANKK